MNVFVSCCPKPVFSFEIARFLFARTVVICGFLWSILGGEVPLTILSLQYAARKGSKVDAINRLDPGWSVSIDTSRVPGIKSPSDVAQRDYGGKCSVGGRYGCFSH